MLYGVVTRQGSSFMMVYNHILVYLPRALDDSDRIHQLVQFDVFTVVLVQDDICGTVMLYIL
jgi:hypothetical protein